MLYFNTELPPVKAGGNVSRRLKGFLLVWVFSSLLFLFSACGSADEGEPEEGALQSVDFSGMFGGSESSDSEDFSRADVGEDELPGEEIPEYTPQDNTGGEMPGENTGEFDIAAELEAVEAQADLLEQKLQDVYTQLDMNEVAADTYQLWDDELNSIWNRLKDILSEEEMTRLTQEEREWIRYKEAETKAVSAPFEGGSMQSLIVSSKEAEFTRERVYELAAYLGEKTGQQVPALSKNDYSGLYVDKMETDEIYSQLELTHLKYNSYQADISLYRLAALSGIAVADGDTLYFEAANPRVKGEIAVGGTGAVLTVTESEFEYLKPGYVFEFSSDSD